MKIKLTPKRYSILYPDPAWSYSNRNTGGSMSSGSEAQYKRVMSFDKLCNMDVNSLTADDAMCFMWITGPMLADGSGAILMREWGFIPKTIAFVWIKTYANGKPVNGMGFYSRSSTEFVLLGTKGRPEVFSHGVQQLIETEEPEVIKSPRMRHSEKPAEVRDRIVELAGNLPRLEMFSRHEVPGWDYHGIELL